MSDSLKKKLDRLKENQGFRTIQTVNNDGCRISLKENGTLQPSLINLSSNDYLGLAGDINLQQHFFKKNINKTHANWMSASSARPLTGSCLAHDDLENELANSYQKEAAILFNSGYHANTGILPAIAQKGDLIIADKLVHASLIDGLKLGDSDFKRFKHNSIEHLKILINKHQSSYENIWVVTESIFSMDGDIAPINELLDLKQKLNIKLFIDEAHAIGCYGDNGLGICEELKVIEQIDIIVGTFGKALAGYGGFAICNTFYKQAIVNFSRSWLFSTALPPINIEWNHHVWQFQKSQNNLRERLFHSTQLLREKLKKNRFNIIGNTHIVPLLIGNNQGSINITKTLKSKGILALPIRSPTVKAGTERIRFSLCANTPNCFDTIIDVLKNHAV